jgi:hypothetical protein
MKTQIVSEYNGAHFLPDLTDKEETAYIKKEFHKLRKSKHVQAMEQLINAAHSVAPTEVDGALFYFDKDENGGGAPAYYLVTEDDEDGEIFFEWVSLIGTAPNGGSIRQLSGKTKEELSFLRFEHVPPRTLTLG